MRTPTTPTRHALRLVAIATAAGSASAAMAQTCSPEWEAVGARLLLDGGVEALAPSADGSSLYLGGAFVFAEAMEVKRVARWDGSTVVPLGLGIEFFTHGLFGCCAKAHALLDLPGETGPTLFVGGDFLISGGLSTESIATWRDGSWADLAGGLQNQSCQSECPPRVYDLLAALGPSGVEVYMAGTFTHTITGSPISRVARWDGSAYHPLGPGIEEAKGDEFPFWAEDLESYNDGSGDAIYVCGRFGKAGGVEAHDVARWDGASWSALGAGLGSAVPGRVTAAKALAVFDDGSGPALYVGGEFDLAGGQPVSNIARWDGTQWSDVGGGTDAQVLALFVHDDGSGPALYAGGQFTIAGGQPASQIARWDGSSWQALGSGVEGGEVLAMATYDDGTGPALFVGGWFQTAGGLPSPYLAKWAGCPGDCYADCDQSTGAGTLDFFDFICFQDFFAAGDPYACDCDSSTGPGVCDFFDFICFQDAFASGC